MGKMSYTRDIGDKQESFDIKIDSQTGDIEIKDIHGNMAFPSKYLIEKLYIEIKRLERNVCEICGEGIATTTLVVEENNSVINACIDCFEISTWLDEGRRKYGDKNGR